MTSETSLIYLDGLPKQEKVPLLPSTRVTEVIDYDLQGALVQKRQNSLKKWFDLLLEPAGEKSLTGLGASGNLSAHSDSAKSKMCSCLLAIVDDEYFVGCQPF